jgi:hypothetical protein
VGSLANDPSTVAARVTSDIFTAEDISGRFWLIAPLAFLRTGLIWLGRPNIFLEIMGDEPTLYCWVAVGEELEWLNIPGICS